MTNTEFFADILGARLTNTVWSWGAESKTSRTLFLRVWRDHVSKDGKWVQIDWPGEGSRNGRIERSRHIEMLRNGQPTFGIVGEAIKLASGGYMRKIRAFDSSTFLRLGVPIKTTGNGIKWASVLGRVDLQTMLSASGIEASLCQDIADIEAKPIGQTQKSLLVDARVGQGKFRTDLLALWHHRCAVTGSVTLAAIRASHILPWKNSTDVERLDPHNGLPLNAGLDALFDRYLITFANNGNLLVSSTIGKSEREILGLKNRKLVNPPAAKCLGYIGLHREIFESLERER